VGDCAEKKTIIVEMGCFGSGGGITRDGRFENTPRNLTWNSELGRWA
jgi:hypothetical protein